MALDAADMGASVPAMAADLPEDVRRTIAKFRPDIADDIGRVAALRRTEDRPALSDEDKLADDLTWLWDFSHEGERLTPRDIEFIITYVRSGFRKAHAALVAAGFRPAERWASPVVLAALHEATRNMARRWEINGYKIGRELASVLFSNITDFCDVSAAGVRMKDLSLLPRELTAAIQEIHEVRNAQGTQLRIKLHDKMTAINMAARIVDLFPKDTLKVEVSGLEERLASAIHRVRAASDDLVGELVIDAVPSEKDVTGG